MSQVHHVYVDFDQDGSFATAGDDLSEYWMSTSAQAGCNTAEERVCSVGRCTIVLRNDTKLFSPLNALGTYYGKLVPSLPVKIEAVEGASTWTYFRGVVKSWAVTSGHQHGDRRAVLECEDYAGTIQRAALALPLQTDTTVDALVKLISAEALDGDAAGATVDVMGIPAANETVTIGTHVYTWKTVLTGAADEVLSATDGDYVHYSARNLAEAVNADVTEGDDYGVGTARHSQVTATGELSFGWPAVYQDGSVELLKVPTGYIGLSQVVGGTYCLETLFCDGIWWYLKKHGSPAYDLTCTLETVSYGSPTGTLYHADATADISASTLTTDYAWYFFAFASTIEIPPATNLRAVLSAAGVASLTDYVILGLDTSKTGLQTSTGGWSSDTASSDRCIFWLGNPRVTLTANARGAWGNAVALATTSTALTLSDSALSGGTDAPAGLLSTESGIDTLEQAADTWNRARTNGLSAITEAVGSEYLARFWVARDGTITFKNRHWMFKQDAAAAVLTLVNHPDTARGMLDRDSVRNALQVQFSPRREAASGIIARADGAIRVSPTHTVVRWNATEGPKASTKIIPYIENDTGEIVGASSLITPVLGTDYTLNTGQSGDGRSYSNPNRFRVAIAVLGGEIQASFKNRSMMTLWVHDLEIRGTALIARSPQTVLDEDTASIAQNGRLEMTVGLPFFVDQNFAEAVASYELVRRSTARYAVPNITWRNTSVVSGVSLHSLDIGDVITLTDTQTGLNANRFLIVGWRGQVNVNHTSSLTWVVKRLDDTGPHWLLGSAGYGELGVNTRLAL